MLWNKSLSFKPSEQNDVWVHRTLLSQVSQMLKKVIKISKLHFLNQGKTPKMLSTDIKSLIIFSILLINWRATTLTLVYLWFGGPHHATGTHISMSTTKQLDGVASSASATCSMDTSSCHSSKNNKNIQCLYHSHALALSVHSITIESI